MNTTVTLELKFGTADGKTRSLSVKNPKSGLTAAELQSAMASIIGLNVFEVKGVNPYAAVNSARYVERTITDVITDAK
jgi:hypothetical protein